LAAAVAIAGPAPDWNFATNVPAIALNSSGDRLFPLEATMSAVTALAARGVPVSASTIDGVDHFNVAGFNAGLRSLLPWLREQLTR
jgi:hypothetical protein